MTGREFWFRWLVASSNPSISSSRACDEFGLELNRLLARDFEVSFKLAMRSSRSSILEDVEELAKVAPPFWPAEFPNEFEDRGGSSGTISILCVCAGGGLTGVAAGVLRGLGSARSCMSSSNSPRSTRDDAGLCLGSFPRPRSSNRESRSSIIEVCRCDG